MHFMGNALIQTLVLVIALVVGNYADQLLC